MDFCYFSLLVSELAGVTPTRRAFISGKVNHLHHSFESFNGFVSHDWLRLNSPQYHPRWDLPLKKLVTAPTHHTRVRRYDGWLLGELPRDITKGISDELGINLRLHLRYNMAPDIAASTLERNEVSKEQRMTIVTHVNDPKKLIYELLHERVSHPKNYFLWCQSYKCLFDWYHWRSFG